MKLTWKSGHFKILARIVIDYLKGSWR
jgi:hypothetical protein